MKKLGEMISKRMRDLGLTYNEVARRAGVSAVYVSGICRGLRFPSDKVAADLARALELSPRALIELARYEKAPPAVKPLYEPEEHRDQLQPMPLGHAQPIPMAGWVQAGRFAPAEGIEAAGGADDYVYSDIKGHNLFALRVENDSMEPLFHPGDYLIVNPNLKPATGDYVIVKLPSEGKATFKKLLEREGLIILRPLNPAYEDIVLTPQDEFEIIGKVVERKTLF